MMMRLSSIIPLLAEEGWMRRAQRRRRRGGQTGPNVFAELLLRLRPIGLALRATPARQLLLSCRATPPLRGGEFCLYLFAILIGAVSSAFAQVSEPPSLQFARPQGSAAPPPVIT